MLRSYTWYLLAIILFFGSAQGEEEDQDFCKEYIYGAQSLPSEKGVATSAFSINDAYPLGDVTVPVNILHPRIQDLRITLSAEAEQEPGAKSRMIRRVLLKDAGQGSGNEMSVVFTDAADDEKSTSKTNSINPVQKLSFLYRKMGRPSVVAASGGAQGTWTLRVEDMAKDESIRIDPALDWSLVLCQISTASLNTQMDPSIGKPTTGQAVSDALQAFAGKPQPVAWAVNAGADKDIEFANNFDSYLGSMNKNCGTEEECDALKKKMWRSAAGLMYLGMKDHIDNDASLSRMSSFFGKIANRTKLGKGEDKNRWKPGQYMSSVADGASTLVQGIVSSLGDTLSALPVMDNIPVSYTHLRAHET